MDIGHVVSVLDMLSEKCFLYRLNLCWSLDQDHATLDQDHGVSDQEIHCKYIGSTQYSFWQCYISHSNLAVVSTADDCVQPTTVSKSSIQS